MDTLHGRLITLRPTTPADFDLFYSWATHSDATPYWYGEKYGTPVPTKEKFANSWKPYYFDGSAPEKGRSFLILVNDEPIGQINYNDINRKENSVELDIIIASDKHKNKGYGSDAIRTLSTYLFTKMGLNRVWIDALEINTRALRAYEKAGFQKTKRYQKHKKFYIRLEQKRALDA